MAIRVVWKWVAAVVPPEGDWFQSFTRRKLKTDFRFQRIGFLVDSRTLRFHFSRIAKLECAERHVCGMASHIAQRAGAEILPTAPHKRMINPAFAATLASAV